jgi:hypothetical protein
MLLCVALCYPKLPYVALCYSVLPCVTLCINLYFPVLPVSGVQRHGNGTEEPLAPGTSNNTHTHTQTHTHAHTRDTHTHTHTRARAHIILFAHVFVCTLTYTLTGFRGPIGAPEPYNLHYVTPQSSLFNTTAITLEHCNPYFTTPHT